MARTPNGTTVSSEPYPVSVIPASRLTPAISPTVVFPGGPTTVSASLTRWETGQPLAGQIVALQYLAAGSSTWVTAANRTSDSQGRVSVVARPAAPGVYRWVYNGRPGVWGGTTSAWVRVSFKPVITATPTATRLRAGSWFTVNANARPAEYLAPMILQRWNGSAWVEVTRSVQYTTGGATVRFQANARMTYQLSVYKPATSKYAASASNTFTVSTY